MLIGRFRWIGLLEKVWSSHHTEFREKSTQLGLFTLSPITNTLRQLSYYVSLQKLMKMLNLNYIFCQQIFEIHGNL